MSGQGSRARRRVAMLVSGASLAAVMVTTIGGGSVEAHHPLIAGTAVCAADGTYLIDYTSTAWEGDGDDASRTNSNVVISALVDGGHGVTVGSGAYAPPTFSFSGQFTLPGTTTSLELAAFTAADWGNGAAGGQTASTVVSLPPGCTASTTTTSTTTTSTTTTSTTTTSTTTTSTTTTTTTPPRGDEGCTPGYWKNHTSAWQGYTPGQTVGSVFTGADVYGGDTLLQALGYTGGSGTSGAARILLRAATAAVLNAAHDAVDYTESTADVIADVNAALASNNRDAMLALAAGLDADNNLGCPLG